MKKRGLSLLWRLVAGMSLVAFVAVLTSAIFLYLRFDASNDRFREETLLAFAKGIGRELAKGEHGFAGTRLAQLHG
jgi:hypothetical protein